MNVTKTNLQKIYDVACSEWKVTIMGYAARNPFGTSVELTESEVERMFAAASATQKTLLKKIFPNFSTEKFAISRKRHRRWHFAAICWFLLECPLPQNRYDYNVSWT